MYVGLDLHKATINATVMDDNENVLNEVKNKVYHGLITKQLLKVDTQIKWANIRKEPNGTVGNFLPQEEKGKR